MAHEFYVSIEFTKQGKNKGESLRKDHKDKITGLSFEYELQVPTDAATGNPSGKRQHKPIVITKEWGASSPQLFQACCHNETLKKVKFEFIKADSAGKEHVYYQIELENAHVSSYKPYTGREEGAKHVEATDTFELEEIEFTFEKISLVNNDAKTTAMDDWRA
jgi:type VI secretion system secreted protein Hcp